MLVAVAAGARERDQVDAAVEELALLADSAGATVVDTVVQERKRKDPGTLIGRGKVAEVAALVAAKGADVVIFDDELSPAQQRNLEEELKVKTLDRTQLILDIFASRARTREGQMQVELAQLNYLLPRLTGHGAAMSQSWDRNRKNAAILRPSRTCSGGWP